MQTKKHRVLPSFQHRNSELPSPHDVIDAHGLWDEYVDDGILHMSDFQDRPSPNKSHVDGVFKVSAISWHEKLLCSSLVSSSLRESL